MKNKIRLSVIGAISALLMLVGVFSASGAALAAQPAQVSPTTIMDAPAQLTEEAQEIVKYVVGAGTADRYFDVEAATAGGASPETLAAGEMFNAFAAAYSSDVSAFAGVPVWGNWCGPGHGGGTPVDLLDSLCKQHDLCYAANGYLNCACDNVLVGQIWYHQLSFGVAERAMANMIAAYFATSPCIP